MIYVHEGRGFPAFQQHCSSLIASALVSCLWTQMNMRTYLTWLRYFAKKSSLVLICSPSVVALSVCSYSAGNSMVPAHLLWSLTLGMSIQTQTHGVTAEVLTALWTVSESPLANVWGRNIIIEKYKIIFSPSFSPSPRLQFSEKSFPCLQKCPFCLMFLYYKTFGFIL